MYGVPCIVVILGFLAAVADAADGHGLRIVVATPEGSESALSVPENSAPGTFLAMVGAYSEDSAFCNANSQGGVVELQQLTPEFYKVVLSRSLDREAITSHGIQIVCMSSGDPALTSTISLLLHVLDVNDNVPVFAVPSFHFSVTRAAPVGTQVGSVQAYDSDINKNGAISYSLKSDQGQGNDLALSIDEYSGLLTTTRSLGLEKNQQVFLVRAADSGIPSHTATASVTLMIED